MPACWEATSGVPGGCFFPFPRLEMSVSLNPKPHFCTEEQERRILATPLLFLRLRFPSPDLQQPYICSFICLDQALSCSEIPEYGHWCTHLIAGEAEAPEMSCLRLPKQVTIKPRECWVFPRATAAVFTPSPVPKTQRLGLWNEKKPENHPQFLHVPTRDGLSGAAADQRGEAFTSTEAKGCSLGDLPSPPL